MFDVHLPTLILAALPGLGLLLGVHRAWVARARALERDLQEYAEVMTRLAETQSRVFRKLSDDVGRLEERLLELSLPSGDPAPPLEQRHRVLTMARKGASSAEIARRLNVPRGEAELIIGLRKYLTAAPPPARGSGEVRTHAQV